MGTRRESWVEGKLQLHSLFKESASSHADQSEEDDLEPSPDGSLVWLVQQRSANNAYQMGSGFNTREVYEIAPSALADLIVKHGRRVTK